MKVLKYYRLSNEYRLRMRWERTFGHPFDWAEWCAAYDEAFEQIRLYL